jgi:hypothetical protein
VWRSRLWAGRIVMHARERGKHKLNHTWGKKKGDWGWTHVKCVSVWLPTLGAPLASHRRTCGRSAELLGRNRGWTNKQTKKMLVFW